LSSLAYGKSRDLPSFRAAHSGFHCLHGVPPNPVSIGSQETLPTMRPRATQKQENLSVSRYRNCTKSILLAILPGKASE